jgi:hypothetical protein
MARKLARPLPPAFNVKSLAGSVSVKSFIMYVSGSLSLQASGIFCPSGRCRSKPVGSFVRNVLGKIFFRCGAFSDEANLDLIFV